MLNVHRAKHFVRGAIQSAEHVERDNPKAFDSQAGNWLLRDLVFAYESLDGPIEGKSYPGSATEIGKVLYKAYEDGKMAKEEDHWPMGEHTLTLAQLLFGAVMPTAMFHTGWPAEYYDMIEVGYLLSKRMSPERIKFVVDAIWKAVDEEELKKTKEEEAQENV